MHLNSLNTSQHYNITNFLFTVLGLLFYFRQRPVVIVEFQVKLPVPLYIFKKYVEYETLLFFKMNRIELITVWMDLESNCLVGIGISVIIV